MALIVLVLTINNLVHAIYDTWQKQTLLTKAQNELDHRLIENQKLKQQLAEVNKSSFIESEARNKLLLTRPNEGIIVIPTNAVLFKPSPTPVPINTTPNWEKWWKLFF